MTKSNKKYISPRRFAQANTTGMLAEDLQKSLDAIELPAREPSLPSAYDLFGTDENKYNPSGFSAFDERFSLDINKLEYAGAAYTFRDFVKALAKKVTSGTAKPDLARIYSEYFAFLSEAMENAIKDLEKAKEASADYYNDKAAYDELNEVFQQQKKYELRWASEDIFQLELEEAQIQKNAELAEENARLRKDVTEIQFSHSKLATMFNSLLKSSNAKEAS